MMVVLVMVLMNSLAYSETIKQADEEQIRAAGYEPLIVSEFREGLVAVRDAEYWENYEFNYLNEAYELVDLNRGRFGEVSPFFEGMAAVVDKETSKVGYINKQGDLVIPCEYGSLDLHGNIYRGFFKEGRAVVFKENYYSSYGDNNHVDETYAAEIDKKGNIVKTYWDFENDINKLNCLVTDMGIIIDHDSVDEEVSESIDVVPNGVTTDASIIENYYAEYIVVDKTPEVVVEPEETIETYNQSSMYFTHTRLLDFGPQVYYRITNDSEKQSELLQYDTSRYALVLAATNTYEIHFLDKVRLAHGDSHMGSFQTMREGELFLQNVNSLILLKFENDEEVDKFRATVPVYVQPVDEVPRDRPYLIDDGEKGLTWFKRYFGIEL